MRLLTLLFLLVLASCKPDKNESTLKFEGFLLRDAFGNQISTVGNAADDWSAGDYTSLNSWEQGLLNFADTVSLANTSVSTIPMIMSYPNPVSDASTLFFNSSDSVKLKLVLVDENETVLLRLARKIKWATLQVDVSDPARFPANRSFRYYYSFSAAGNPHFKAGYGDIRICRSAAITDCF